MSSAPDRSDNSLSFDQIRAAVTSLHTKTPLQVVVFAGGEPLLLGNDLLDAVALCDSLGIVTRVVTNAYWATSISAARRLTNVLREAGLAELNISCDDYHLPFIPFERVEFAWQASKNMGFTAVIIATCACPTSTITPSFIMDRLEEDLPLRFDTDGYSIPRGAFDPDGTYYGMSNGKVQLIGRARTTLDHTITVSRNAGADDLKHACPWALRNPAVTPENRLVACCGIELMHNSVLDFGSLDASDASSLLEIADDMVLPNSIALFGPKYLMDFVRARSPKIAWRERYGSICEICEDIVNRDEVLSCLDEHSKELGTTVWAVRSQLEEGKTRNE